MSYGIVLTKGEQMRGHALLLIVGLLLVVGCGEYTESEQVKALWEKYYPLKNEQAELMAEYDAHLARIAKQNQSSGGAPPTYDPKSGLIRTLPGDSNGSAIATELNAVSKEINAILDEMVTVQPNVRWRGTGESIAETQRQGLQMGTQKQVDWQRNAQRKGR